MSKYIYGCIECGSEFKTENRGMDGANCPSCKGKLSPLRVDDYINYQEIVTHAKYECLTCGHSDFVRGKRYEYQEVRLCPCCNGLYVDSWKVDKFKHLLCKEKDKGKVIIELTEADKPPKVFIKGKRVPVNSLELNYKTDTEVRGEHDFHLIYVDEKEKMFKRTGFKKL